MSGPEDKEIFNLFGSRLTETNKMDEYSDENWDRMEHLLDGQTRKRTPIVWLYRIASGVAATLFMFLVFNIFNPNAQKVNQLAKLPVRKTIKPSPEKKFDGKENKELIAAVNSDKIQQASTLPPVGNKPGLEQARSASTMRGDNIRPDLQDKTADSLTAASIASVVLHADDAAIDDMLSPGATNLTPDSTKTSLAHTKRQHENVSHSTPRMTFIVLAASDINGVNSFNNERTGTNLTLQLSLKLTKRLSISTGAGYAVKPYQTGFSGYKTNSPGWWGRMFATANKPNNVLANCKVLDIPLNVNYELFNKGRNSFAIGGGLSSYFMLNENYRFSFADPALGSRNIQISNQNQHIFGVLNLNSTYQHRVNSNFGIVVQPYLKLPLTQIGFGQVDLKSAGVAVGFSWNINSFRRR